MEVEIGACSCGWESSMYLGGDTNGWNMGNQQESDSQPRPVRKACDRKGTKLSEECAAQRTCQDPPPPTMIREAGHKSCYGEAALAWPRDTLEFLPPFFPNN